MLLTVEVTEPYLRQIQGQLSNDSCRLTEDHQLISPRVEQPKLKGVADSPVRRRISDRRARRGGWFGTVGAKNLAEMAASAALRPAARAQAYPPPLAIGARLVLTGDLR